MFATIRDRARPLKNLRNDLFFKLFTKFRSRHSTDFTSHVRINSGFSPLSTKRRALHTTYHRPHTTFTTTIKATLRIISGPH